MKRPVEVYRKKTKLLWIALFSLAFGGASMWLTANKCDAFSLQYALRSIGEVILIVGGLVALVRLLSSLIRREPYLLVYDDHIEVYNEFSNRFSVLHFGDVVYMEKKNITVNFRLEPFLKKSDFPEWFRLCPLGSKSQHEARRRLLSHPGQIPKLQETINYSSPN